MSNLQEDQLRAALNDGARRERRALLGKARKCKTLEEFIAWVDRKGKTGRAGRIAKAPGGLGPKTKKK